MSESKLQTKSIKLLQSAGWYVIRIIAASKAGVLDLACCDPKGLFVAIEIKFGNNKTSKLQDYNIEQIQQRKGFTYVVYDTDRIKEIIYIHSVQEKV